jgi:hypothetical protein
VGLAVKVDRVEGWDWRTDPGGRQLRARVVDLETGRDVAAVPPSEEQRRSAEGCVLEEPAPRFSAAIRELQADTVKVALQNQSEANGVVSVLGIVPERSWRRELASFELAGGEARTVELRLGGLELPSSKFVSAGKLSLTAKIEFTDGEAATESAGNVYYALSLGGVELSDEPLVRTEHLTLDAPNFLREYPVAALRVPDPDGSPPSGHGATRDEREHDEATDYGPPPVVENIYDPQIKSEPVSGASEEPSLTPQGGGYVWKTLCFSVVATYNDSANGEDHWTESGPTGRPASGMNAHLKPLGHSEYSAYYLDEDGCLAMEYIPSSWYDVVIFSHGYVSSHYLSVVKNSGTLAALIQPMYVLEGSGTQIIVPFSPDSQSDEDEFNAYLAAAFALLDHSGLTDGDALRIRTSQTSNKYNSSIDEIWIKNLASSQKKYTVAHEVGHWIHYRSGGHGVTDYGVNGTPQICSSPGSHTMESIEYSGAAYNEGFANFYAADAFNNHGNDGNCSTKQKGVTYDCAAAQAFMHNECDGPYAGRGVERDWMQMFWSMHTNTANNPTMNEMLRWMENANDSGSNTNGLPWTKSNATERLGAQAPDEPSSTHIPVRWAADSIAHGIHPNP